MARATIWAKHEASIATRRRAGPAGTRARSPSPRPQMQKALPAALDGLFARSNDRQGSVGPVPCRPPPPYRLGTGMSVRSCAHLARAVKSPRQGVSGLRPTQASLSAIVSIPRPAAGGPSRPLHCLGRPVDPSMDRRRRTFSKFLTTGVLLLCCALGYHALGSRDLALGRSAYLGVRRSRWRTNARSRAPGAVQRCGRDADTLIG